MNWLSSYDVSSPLINPRVEKLWTFHDPLGFRRNYRYEFEMDIFDIPETESRALVLKGDRVIETSATYGDGGRLGSGRLEALRDAQRFIAEFDGTGLDVAVVVKLSITPGFHDPDTTPFYQRAARCFHMPKNWWRHDDAPDAEEQLWHSEDFTIWRNGAALDDGYRLDQVLGRMIRQDIGAEWRNGQVLVAREYDAYLAEFTADQDSPAP